ncbi:hypothetical protein ESCOCK438M_25960 [Escherichia coli]
MIIQQDGNFFAHILFPQLFPGLQPFHGMMFNFFQE